VIDGCQRSGITRYSYDRTGKMNRLQKKCFLATVGIHPAAARHFICRPGVFLGAAKTGRFTVSM